MDPEREKFLNLRHIPPRLNAEEAAWFLGFNADAIPRLTRARLLKPLGDPNRCTTKFYSRNRLRRLGENELWLHKASKATNKYWQDVNQRRKKKRHN